MSGIEKQCYAYDMKSMRIRTSFFMLLLAGVLVLVFFMLLPYLKALAIAATATVILYPWYEKLLLKTGGKRALSAMAMVLFTILLLLLPLSLIGVQIASEATTLYADLRGNSALLPSEVVRALEEALRKVAPDFSPDLSKYAGQALNWIAGNLQSFFAGTIQTVLLIFLGIFASYYMFKDGHLFVETLIELSPLTEKEDRNILSRLRAAVNSVIRGSLIIATLQGVVAGIGLAIFGIPSAVLLGSIAGIAALIPTLGTTVVLGPVIVYLLFAHDYFAAVGLTVWAILAVGLIDNLLHPILVGRGMKMHPAFIFFSVIGGIGLFGLSGFILGPLLVSLLFGLLEIFREEMKRK